MKARLAAIAITIWLITFGVFAYFFIRGWTSQSADQRTAIHLSPTERDMVLSEMRQMLHSVHNLVTGLSAGDRRIMEAAARASGVKIALEENPIIMTKMPLEFRRQGMSVHQDFDALADHIANGADQTVLLREFTGITARCVGCHTSYRLP